MSNIFLAISRCVVMHFWATPDRPLHTAMSLLDGWQVERMMQKIVAHDPGFPLDEPLPERPPNPANFPTDVPAPEPHDIPPSEPIDVPPSDPGPVPQPKPSDPTRGPEPRTIP